jgi:hypothetical protein
MRVPDRRLLHDSAVEAGIKSGSRFPATVLRDLLIVHLRVSHA